MQDLENNVFSHHEPTKNSVTAAVSCLEQSTARPREQFTVAIWGLSNTEIFKRDVMQRTVTFSKVRNLGLAW